MKILHWDEMFHPSFGYQINVLAKFQALQGHDVTIFTSKNIEHHPTFAGLSSGKISELDDEYEKKYHVGIVRLPIYGVISGRVIYKPGFLKKIKEFNPDVLMCHTNDTLSAMIIARNYKYLNIPMVFDNHMLEMASKNVLRSAFRKYFRCFITPMIIKNNWVVIRTQNDPYVNKCLGIPKQQTPFISFGTDTTLFKPDLEAKKLFRRQYGIADNEIVFVYSGKLTEAKGGKILADVFKKKLSEHRKVTLIAVGTAKGEYGCKVEKIFTESENRILRFPTQKYVELSKFYQAADVAIFPKQCSLSFYDVQACGLPTILEDNHVNIERVSYGNGITYHMDDIIDLEKKIKDYIIMSEENLSVQSSNSIKFAEKYSYEGIAAEYTKVLYKEAKRRQKI